MQKLIFTIIACTLVFSACSRREKAEPVIPSGNTVVINGASIKPGEAKFFEYKFRGKEIRFIVGRTDTGAFVTAFDACATCYVYKKGYRAEPGCVICNECGSRFRLGEMEKGLGNCVPIALPHAVQGDSVFIRLSDIEDGYRWF